MHVGRLLRGEAAAAAKAAAGSVTMFGLACTEPSDCEKSGVDQSTLTIAGLLAQRVGDDTTLLHRTLEE